MTSKNAITQTTYNKVAQQYWEKEAGMDQCNNQVLGHHAGEPNQNQKFK